MAEIFSEGNHVRVHTSDGRVFLVLRDTNARFTDSAEAETPEVEISKVRAEFIEEAYPKLFGPEEMGDPSRDMNPEELTAVLVAYENYLVRHGLEKFLNQQ